MKQSKFIVVEGLEGAGKTHACQLISKILKEHKIENTMYVRQPGSTPFAERIRDLIKKK